MFIILIYIIFNDNDLLSLINSETIYITATGNFYSFLVVVNFFPNHSVTNFFVQSIIALLLAIGYTYLSYNFFLENNILEVDLYSGLDGLYSIFANEILLLIFWLHFLAISLFTGAWIVRCKDVQFQKLLQFQFNFDLFHRSTRFSNLWF